MEETAMTTTTKELPISGQTFSVEGDIAFLILPAQSSDKLPWVWYAPTLPGLPGAEEVWMFDRFLQAGIALSMSVNRSVTLRVEHAISPFTNI